MPNMNDWRSMTDMVDVTRTIYNHLQDEESKHIFENRLLYRSEEHTSELQSLA